VYGLPYDEGYFNEVTSKADKLKTINFKGSLRPDEVMPTLSKYKAVIVPSLVAEMASLIILEANKLKVPVIASEVPGNQELIRQYECGVVFKYGSSEDLVKKILWIERDPVFIFSSSSASFFNLAEKYLELYNGQ
jgi:glycosyltransferase involved in cell wall biosynthesis